jgi:SAM-dependent methyltransferase
MANNTAKWFASWFDTPFYHILYKHRNDTEAQLFMDNLTQYLNIPEQGTILDLACGKGRHSIYLNTLGYHVTGVDLSENSIAFAKQYENNSLHFDVHNMCIPYKEKFDAVFNLFTSFGYFDDPEDNLSTIKAIKSNLNASGFGVIDFMNTDYVLANLIPEDSKTIDGITFYMKRFLKDGFVTKTITFEAEGETYNFEERVKAFTLADFKVLFEQAEVDLLDVFGDYKLNKYNKDTSERLIMLFK